MSKGVSDKITYKPYDQGQAYLIPPRVDELIPENHLVRLVSKVIDEMGIEGLLRKYRAVVGASRYHPQMKTKLFVYGYMTKVCSSRMLAKAVRENVMFMWLAGGQKPDFRTLNDFRGKTLKAVMEEIFVTAVKMLKAKGYIKLENYFIDGTKIESAAGGTRLSGRKRWKRTTGNWTRNCGRI
jgi:transposase